MNFKHVEAFIYLADQRHCSQTAICRSFHTFYAVGHAAAYKKSLDKLCACDDVTLTGGSSNVYTVAEDTVVILIPVVGAIRYKVTTNKTGEAEAGEVDILALPKGATINVSNPYPDDRINFIFIQVNEPTIDGSSGFVNKVAFDLGAGKNKLIELFSEALGVTAYIGKFDGRCEGNLIFEKSSNHVFGFVIEGVFEVQNRLLQYRDGLALRNVTGVDFEALSPDAIIFLLAI